MNIVIKYIIAACIGGLSLTTTAQPTSTEEVQAEAYATAMLVAAQCTAYYRIADNEDDADLMEYAAGWMTRAILPGQVSQLMSNWNEYVNIVEPQLRNPTGDVPKDIMEKLKISCDAFLAPRRDDLQKRRMLGL